MLDLLDIRTLAFTTIFFGLCFGLGLITYSSTLKKFNMVFQIGLGILFIGLAQFLISLRNHVNDFISIVIANELNIIALILIYIGLHKLCRMKFTISKAFIVTLLLFIFFSFSYYTYIDPSMKARVAIISCVISLLCLLCAHVGLQCQAQRKRITLTYSWRDVFSHSDNRTLQNHYRYQTE